MVVGEDVKGLPSFPGQQSRSAMVNVRPARLHSRRLAVPAVTV
jgi:hypothetical protein